jgi:hypothetical protein
MTIGQPLGDHTPFFRRQVEDDALLATIQVTRQSISTSSKVTSEASFDLDDFGPLVRENPRSDRSGDDPSQV